MGAPALLPEIDAGCTICGSRTLRTIASTEELAAQQRYLRLFHRRRLRVRSDESLEERADFTQDYATNVVACADCGLIFRDPRPDDGAVTRAYADDSYGDERLRALFESQVELFRPKAHALARRLGKRRPDVVEIGSFVGGFLAAGKELGWNIAGIDPGREVVRFCDSRGLAVLCESVDRCEHADASLDAVVVWNTFDQLPDPHPTLAAASRWLKPGGLLVVRVPNGRAFEKGMQRLRIWPGFARRALLAAMAWNNLLAFPYLHGYSPAVLDPLLESYGFERVAIEPDVLTRLADDQTARWAALEERTLKLAWKLLARIRKAPAPWIDATYRKVFVASGRARLDEEWARHTIPLHRRPASRPHDGPAGAATR